MYEFYTFWSVNLISVTICSLIFFIIIKEIKQVDVRTTSFKGPPVTNVGWGRRFEPTLDPSNFDYFKNDLNNKNNKN